MSKLFEETKINGMVLRNRFVRSATMEGLADEQGGCTEGMVNLLSGLAAGGVGLIITGHVFVSKKGRAAPFQAGLDQDFLTTGYRELTDEVHRQGGRIAIQLAHAGLSAFTKLTGEPALAPSLLSGFTSAEVREMTRADIEETIVAFGRAAERAVKAGFDGIQIQAAHGYLLNQFLSPAFNHRTDEYGGSLENRARAAVETLRGIRQRVGRDFPVLAKLNSCDFLEGGLELGEAIQAVVMLKEAGLDAVELSGGTLASGSLMPSRAGINSREKEAYHQESARRFKQEVDLPLILVGGIRSLETAEMIVAEGIADFAALSRPLIREPDLIKRWESGDISPARCLSDNKCFAAALSGGGVHCSVEKES